MKKITVVLLSAILVIGLVGCGKEDKKNENKNKNLETTKTNISEEEYVNCFDINNAVSSVMINDQQMTFPIEISKLKSTIVLGGLQEVIPPNFYKGSLADESVSIGAVEVYSESGDAAVDGQIHFLEVSEGSPWYLSVCGVTFGASIDEVKAAVGTPVFESGEAAGTYRVYYENCSYEYLSFLFIEGKLKTISFEYLPQELRPN